MVTGTGRLGCVLAGPAGGIPVGSNSATQPLTPLPDGTSWEGPFARLDAPITRTAAAKFTVGATGGTGDA